MNDIKLIAFDLDGTLLTTNKELTEETKTALKKAADKGMILVPATGRFFTAMPEEIRSLPFIRYAITINGALVYDSGDDLPISIAEIPYPRAIELMEYLDTLPVVYDCFIDSWGWMSESQKMKVSEYVALPHHLEMVKRLRSSVPDLKTYVKERGRDVQKVQFYSNGPELQQKLLRTLPVDFPDLTASSSFDYNVEVNSKNANKGNALLLLADHLGIRREQTLAFGDGLNDLDMIRAAGTGIAMENACPELKEIADIVTASCDDNGVARVIDQICRVNL